MGLFGAIGNFATTNTARTSGPTATGDGGLRLQNTQRSLNLLRKELQLVSARLEMLTADLRNQKKLKNDLGQTPDQAPAARLKDCNSYIAFLNNEIRRTKKQQQDLKRQIQDHETLIRQLQR